MSETISDKELATALAVLISSTRSKKRQKSLTEIADWLAIATTRLGSIRAVADRIGLSPQMLRQFDAIRKLSPKVQELFVRRELDSVDAAAHLSMLPSKDQFPVAQLLAEGKLDTSDVRAIHQLRKSGSDDPIQSLISRVDDSKTKQEYIVEFVVRGSQDPLSINRALIKFIPPNEIIALNLNGALGRLVLTKKGRAALAASSRNLKVPLKSVMAAILQHR